MKATIAALTLAVFASVGCGHGKSAFDNDLHAACKALRIEVISVEMMYRYLLDHNETSLLLTVPGRKGLTYRDVLVRSRKETGPLIQKLALPPPGREETCRIVRDLSIALGEAETVLSVSGSFSESEKDAASSAMKKVRELRAKLSLVAPPGII
jgi:hypothetical protein